MADAETTRYQFVKPEVGASSDTWGSKWNTNADDYDALSGALTTGGSSSAYTLTTGLSLAAYVSGQRFLVKWNHTNGASASLNVDGLGAKTIKKRDASTNCSASDLVSGAFAFVAYDGTNFALLSPVASDFQALDATLTALAALSWSSGNALVQFTAADTVSLTLAPSVTSVTASNGSAATTPAGTFTNTTDAAANTGLVVQSDRATPANGDSIGIDLRLSDSAGNQDTFGRIQAVAQDVTSGAEYGYLQFGVRLNGTLTNRLYLSYTNLAPLTNDTVALGAATQGYADGYWASGATQNFNNGNVVLTHSSGLLSLTTGKLKAPTAISTDTGGTLTSASDNAIVDLATAPTINDGVHAAGAILVLVNNTASSMTITQDTGMTLRLHGSTSTGNRTLAARGVAQVLIDPVDNAEAIVMGDVS